MIKILKRFLFAIVCLVLVGFDYLFGLGVYVATGSTSWNRNRSIENFLNTLEKTLELDNG